MARDRQRAKRRQAERRAERLAGREHAPAPARRDESPQPHRDDPPPARRDETPASLRDEAPASVIDEDDIEQLADLEAGAPPPELGRSDYVVAHESALDDGDDLEGAELVGDGDGAVAARPGTRAADQRHGRLVAFLIAVWAELGRVQWPDRKQLTQLTVVVLFFVLVIGAYLGGLDAVFSKLINAIL